MTIAQQVMLNTLVALIAIAIYLENGGTVYVSAPVIDHNGNSRRSI